MEQSNATKIRVGKAMFAAGTAEFPGWVAWVELCPSGWEIRTGHMSYDGDTWASHTTPRFFRTATLALEAAEKAWSAKDGYCWTRARGALGACRRVDAERARNVTMAQD